MPYIFFPLASDSAVGFTGFTLAASAGGILDSGAGVFAGGSSFCAHSANARKSKRRRISGVLFFNTPFLFGSTVETSNDTPQPKNVHEKIAGREPARLRLPMFNDVWRPRAGVPETALLLRRQNGLMWRLVLPVFGVTEVTLVTPLASEDYRSITKQFLDSWYCLDRPRVEE